MTSALEPSRIEHDLLGDFPVPVAAYYGVHTARAAKNFPISGIEPKSHPVSTNALAAVKQGSAATNRDPGLLDRPKARPKARAIIAACEDIRAGRLRKHFILDMIQGGAGTSRT